MFFTLWIFIGKDVQVVAALLALNVLKEEDFYFEQILESLNCEYYKLYGSVWYEMGNIFI